MLQVDPAVAAALLGSHSRRARLTTLYPDRSTRQVYADLTARQLSGSATYDRGREVRRTVSLSLANTDGSLSPRRIDDPFAKGQWIRCETGIRLADTTYWIQMFEGVVSSSSAGMRGTLAVTGDDPLSLLQQPFGAAFSLDPNLTGELAIRALWEPVLGGGSLWSLDAGGRTVGAVRSYLEGDDRLAAGITLARDLGCEVFSDRFGQPVLQPVPDPSKLPSTSTFQTLPRTGNLIDGSRSQQSVIYNRVITVDNSPDYGPVRGQADVTDPASPIHASRIGLHVAPIYTSAQLVTQDRANAVAAALLVQYALFDAVAAYSALPLDTTDEGDVGTFSEPISGADDRHWLAQVVHPLTTGPMQVTGPKAIPVFG